ncbi:hypothetical protein [Roseobacter sp. MED193]|uniref:hypothetical protein n=1 Tax=Roseobacter sp. MED193 TaxID=314262 RepID=UPI000A03EBA4|nr:hypothetical protein [Roseobacter sp. MED193]
MSPRNASRATVALNLSEKFRRFVILVSIQSGWIHLSTLSEFAGPLHPWEVTPAIKLSELVRNHTEFVGDEALYTATIVLVMNRLKYDSLPEDLRAAIDAESGQKLSEMAAEVMWAKDARGREIAEDAGNSIVQLSEAEVARFKEKSQPVIARWVSEMEGQGIDGRALIETAKALIKDYGG